MRKKRPYPFWWVLLAALVAPVATAQPKDVHHLSNGTAVIDGPSGRAAFERAIDDLSSLLQNFEPAGAKISGKSVRGTNVTFTATKAVIDFGFGSVDTSAVVRGDVSQKKPIVCAAPNNATGYRIAMDLRKSDSLVSDNASSIFVDICLKELGGGAVEVTGKSFMFEGSNFGKIAGPSARDLLKQQTRPLIAALKKTAGKYRVSLLHDDLLDDLKRLAGDREELACQ